MSQKNQAPSNRARLRRAHERGSYDDPSLYAMLDALPHAHVGYVLDGAPVVTPTFQWREGNHVYWHGSSASRMLKKSEGMEVCLTASALDGFVLARSGFHHSVNYRSVTLFGTASKVECTEAKEARLKAFVDGLFPGRWEMLRTMTGQELKATTILSMPIDEASAKMRTGGPIDDEEDYALPIWAGVVPLAQQVLPAVADPRNLEGVTPPEHVTNFRFG